MEKVRSLSGTPNLYDFTAGRGTPIVIDTSTGVYYCLLDGDIIIDMRTGAEIGTAVEDDLAFPATSTKQGALSKPDFDTTNIGLLFPQNDTSEIAYYSGQLPHKYALHPRTYLGGTPIVPHVHFRQTSANVPTFKLDYKWFNIGDTEPSTFTTITTSSADIYTPWVSGDLAQMLKFPEIDGTGMKASSILLMKLWRDDNVVSGDVLVHTFDIHYLGFCMGTLRG